MSLLGVQISNNSIQRLYDCIDFIDNPDVEEVWIDYVAIRKGQTYSTAIMVDIMFKMMDDGHSNETIYFYIQRQPSFHESKQKLA